MSLDWKRRPRSTILLEMVSSRRSAGSSSAGLPVSYASEGDGQLTSCQDGIPRRVDHRRVPMPRNVENEQNHLEHLKRGSKFAVQLHTVSAAISVQGDETHLRNGKESLLQLF